MMKEDDFERVRESIYHVTPEISKVKNYTEEEIPDSVTKTILDNPLTKEEKEELMKRFNIGKTAIELPPYEARMFGVPIKKAMYLGNNLGTSGEICRDVEDMFFGKGKASSAQTEEAK